MAALTGVVVALRSFHGGGGKWKIRWRICFFFGPMVELFCP